jgi:segregation and condensation protein B
MHESPDDDISLMPDPDTPPEQTATTSNPDDALATQTTVDSVVEAVLFACDEPVTVAKLAGIVECTPKQIKTSVEALNQQYKQHNRAFRIEQIAGGLQMLTLPYYDHWLRKMIKVRADNKLTPSALETLAIVAYKQPAIRADIEAIRGVASGEMLRGLMVKGLVKMVGRAEVVGRPMQYGTTKKFLECFGLNSLKDLPQIEELKRPQVESDENEDAD